MWAAALVLSIAEMGGVLGYKQKQRKRTNDRVCTFAFVWPVRQRRMANGQTAFCQLCLQPALGPAVVMRDGPGFSFPAHVLIHVLYEFRLSFPKEVLVCLDRLCTMIVRQFQCWPLASRNARIEPANQ